MRNRIAIVAAISLLLFYIVLLNLPESNKNSKKAELLSNSKVAVALANTNLPIIE